MTDSADLPVSELAAGLAAKVGRGTPRGLVALAGGRNNRVYRVSFADGGDAVLKCYHHDPRDPRDRLAAEWGFLAYVGARGVRNVPTPLAAEPARHAALYRFIPGARATHIDAHLLEQASAFVAAINGAPHRPDELAPASEACFSLADHLATIEDRVTRLNDIDASAPYAAEARAFVQERLVPTWRAVRANITRDAAMRSIAPEAPIRRQIVSPSDFGFHNALVDAHGHVSFLDFEYAGRDDPAKLICDFFCQPEIPVPPEHHAAFTAKLAASLGLDENDVWRARALLDAYRVKWICIMLNEFSPLGRRRRAFASAQDDKSRSVHQLRAAERHLALIRF
jgi:hypothetical protein